MQNVTNSSAHAVGERQAGTVAGFGMDGMVGGRARSARVAQRPPIFSSWRAASIVYLAHGFASRRAFGIGLPVSWHTP